MAERIEDVLLYLARQLLASTCNLTFSQGSEEPYMECNETDENLILTYELPGVQAEDIQITIDEKNIQLKIEPIGYASIHQTPKIKPKKTDIRYRNGILEIKALKS